MSPARSAVSPDRRAPRSSSIAPRARKPCRRSAAIRSRSSISDSSLVEAALAPEAGTGRSEDECHPAASADPPHIAPPGWPASPRGGDAKAQVGEVVWEVVKPDSEDHCD